MSIGWGYDAGDHYAHVSTNVSPLVDGLDLEFFYTSEIQSVQDAASGEILWEAED